MSRKTIIVVEEVFETENKERRLEVLGELFYQVIKQAELNNNHMEINE